MRVSQVTNSSLHRHKSASFGAFISKRFMDRVLLDDVSNRIRSAATSQDKEKMFRLTEQVFKKAKEITAWDNKYTIVDIVPRSSDYKIQDTFDLVVSSYRDASGRPLDGIGYSATVKTFDSAKTGIADVFVNLSKKAYLRAKRPFVVAEAQKVFNESTDLSVLEPVKKRLGSDSFELFKHEFFRLKKGQDYGVKKVNSPEN